MRAGAFRLLRRVGGIFPGIRRGRAELDKLVQWTSEASEQELLDALADEDRNRRRYAAWQLCARDPDRPVEPLIAAARQGAGREPRPDDPPGPVELLELDLAYSDCKGLHSFELFSHVLSDAGQDNGLRVQAACVLGTLEDPRAAEALKAATADPDGAIRQIARIVLGGKAAFDDDPDEKG